MANPSISHPTAPNVVSSFSRHLWRPMRITIPSIARGYCRLRPGIPLHFAAPEKNRICERSHPTVIDKETAGPHDTGGCCPKALQSCKMQVIGTRLKRALIT